MVAAESDHFVLLAPCKHSQCVEMINLFEYTRRIFEHNLNLRAPEQKILVYVVPAESLWPDIGSMQKAHGFYIRLPSRDVIVLKNLSRWVSSGLHEFTHLWARQRYPNLPSWLNEGLAQYFEGTVAVKDGLRSGFINANRIRLLRSERWLPPERIFTTDHPRSFHSDRDRSIFYAQSWAFVHLLRLSPPYASRFAQLVEAVNRGESAEKALMTTLSIDTKQLYKEAQKWVNKDEWPAEVLQQPAPLQLKVRITPASNMLASLVHASVSGYSLPKAARLQMYDQMVKSFGGSCESALLLADLAYNFALAAEALGHYREAARCGFSVKALPTWIQGALTRPTNDARTAVQSSPPVKSEGSISTDLAVERYRAGDFEGALAATDDLSEVYGEQLFRAVRVRALSMSRLGRFDEAEKLAAMLSSLSGTVYEQATAALTVKDIQNYRLRAQEDVETPIEVRLLRDLPNLEGWIVRLDCAGAPTILHVETQDRGLVKLAIIDPATVVTDLMTKLDMPCGPQKRRALVAFEPLSEPIPGIAGNVRFLRLQD